jgi:hypothetical protein
MAMGDDPASILSALKDAKIAHDPTTLSKFEHQGLMSSVYTVSGSDGDLIIHVSRLSPTLEHFRIWEKMQPVSRFLRAIPGVPAAEVLYTVKWPKYFLAVQRKLPGHRAGTVSFKDGSVHLAWEESPASIERQLEDVIASVHTAPMRGFGQLIVDGIDMRGQYDSWEKFLRNDTALWIEGISKADRQLGRHSEKLAEDAAAFCDAVIDRVAALDHTSLVSCDAMNPSNVLVEGGKVTGIIDWEWAFAADPAWEFAYMNTFSLEHYFSLFPALASEPARRRFLQRAQIYEYLLYTMWCFAISGDPESYFYKVTHDRLQSKLSGAEEFLRNLDQA